MRQEIQVAILNNNVLGAIELVPKRHFMIIKLSIVKRQKQTHHASKTKSKNYFKVSKLAKKAHKALNCRGVTRTDFKFFKNKFYLLELNTQPGMTSLSLVPEISKYSGIIFEDLVEKILLDASIDR